MPRIYEYEKIENLTGEHSFIVDKQNDTTKKTNLDEIKNFVLNNCPIGSNTNNGIVTVTANQSLHNKTFFMPKINSDIEINVKSEEINKLAGLNASTAELNLLNGLKANASNLNNCLNSRTNLQQQIDLLNNHKAVFDVIAQSSTLTITNLEIKNKLGWEGLKQSIFLMPTVSIYLKNTNSFRCVQKETEINFNIKTTNDVNHLDCIKISGLTIKQSYRIIVSNITCINAN